MVCSVNDEVVEFAVHGNDIYLRTAHNAPRYKIVMTSLSDLDFSKAMVIVEPSDMVVDGISLSKDALYVGLNDGGFGKLLRLEYEQNAKASAFMLTTDQYPPFKLGE